jgi:hypothetical protein
MEDTSETDPAPEGSGFELLVPAFTDWLLAI